MEINSIISSIKSHEWKGVVFCSFFVKKGKKKTVVSLTTFVACWVLGKRGTTIVRDPQTAMQLSLPQYCVNKNRKKSKRRLIKY